MNAEDAEGAEERREGQWVIEMKLYWRNEHIGNVERTGAEQPSIGGTFELVTGDPVVIEFLRICIDESREHEVSDYVDDLWEHWTLVDDQGSSEAIFMPAVYIDEGQIVWQPKSGGLRRGNR